MLDEVVRTLACAHCGAPFTTESGRLRCANEHTFDIARQGYVNLLPGAAAGGDTAEMVAARAEFLNRGHYTHIVDELAELARHHVPGGGVVDIGAGTGYYLAGMLDRLAGGLVDGFGIALDVSKYAARRAAKAHPRVGAAVADTWRAIPVRDAAACAVLNVFAPRNAAEIHRVLRPDGRLFVVTPLPEHLGELVDALGLISVDEHKQHRLDTQLGEHFDLLDQRVRRCPMSLDRVDARALVRMGPSAWHTGPAELARRLDELAEPVAVTSAVTIAVYRPRPLTSLSG